MVFVGVCAVSPALAQVDGEMPSQDTLYIIEEEIVYDTLYLYDTLPDPALMSKEELLQAFKQDRGIGFLYYKKGALYLNGGEELYKLEKADVEQLLSKPQFDAYCNAKRDHNICISLYALSGCGAVVAALGFVQFTANFVAFSNYHNGSDLSHKIWLSGMGGVLLFGCGSIIYGALYRAAVIYKNKSKEGFDKVVNNFNGTPTTTSMELRVGPTPGGMGLTLSF
jgi:hypothetical protein